MFGLTLILLAGLVAMATGLILKFAIFYQKHILSKIDQLDAKNAIKVTAQQVFRWVSNREKSIAIKNLVCVWTCRGIYSHQSPRQSFIQSTFLVSSKT